MNKILFLLVVFVGYTIAQNKLKVDIFYEALCPDSLNFIKYQLKPSWEQIKPAVTLNFVPFGKSVSFNDANFECHHGPRECEGNKVMSCALHRIRDPTVMVHFVSCYMNRFMKYARRNSKEFGQSCVAKAGLNWNDDIKQCYESHLGTLLQLNAEKQTNVYKLDFIPTIIYNKIFDRELHNASLYNFKGVVCSLARVNRPSTC
ncbi:hypothetical protein AMK59_4067 [Oryctes borbonicus]|uniref:Gamma interferon inducible lysosomal thiol reductase n=1 Tax=Oryctes borbonicus TaxID=1629725 RepID=A0A0T6B814_9SCAR|nr:hypothetical protein AMK59_4067 [Oryctes borbonicus]